MQSGQTATVAAGAAVPSEIQSTDPRHLNNLTKNMTQINAQVSNDTKYDPTPPPRVDKDGNPIRESFVSELEASEVELRAEKLYAVGAIAAIVGVCVLVIAADPKMRAPLSNVQNGYLFLGLSGIICLITIYIIVRALRTNEIITWYPQLRG